MNDEALRSLIRSALETNQFDWNEPSSYLSSDGFSLPVSIGTYDFKHGFIIKKTNRVFCLRIDIPRTDEVAKPIVSRLFSDRLVTFKPVQIDDGSGNSVIIFAVDDFGQAGRAFRVDSILKHAIKEKQLSQLYYEPTGIQDTIVSLDGKAFKVARFENRNHYRGVPALRTVITPPSQEAYELIREISGESWVAMNGNLILYSEGESDLGPALHQILTSIRGLDVGFEWKKRMIFDLDFFKATYEDRINSLIADGKNLGYFNGMLHAWRRIGKDIIELWIDNPGKNTLLFEIKFNGTRFESRTAHDYAEATRVTEVILKRFQEISSSSAWETNPDK